MHNDRKNYKDLFMTLEQKGGFGGKHCDCCGNWITNDEPVLIVIFNGQNRPLINKGKNLLIHKTEWEELLQSKTPEQIVQFFQKAKKRPSLKWNEDQQLAAEVFKKVMRQFGYTDFTISKDKTVIKAKKRGTSLVYLMNVFTLQIENESRARSGFFVDMLRRELAAKIYNEVHEELKTGKRDTYSVSKVMDEALKITEEIMGN